MSNTDKQIISIKELSDFNKWLEVLEYSDITYCFTKNYLDLYKTGEKLIKSPIIDWSKINKTVGAGFKDEIQGSEIYLRLVEAHFKTTIKTGAQLRELTIDKDQNPKDNEEIEYSQFLVDSSNIFKYEVYLYYLLSVTKDYKELTKIKLSDFNIKENKDKNTGGRFENTQEGFILKSIAFKYNLGEMELRRPPLRDIANLIKAPYSVVLEAYKLLKF